jgi:hypothetical protein
MVMTLAVLVGAAAGCVLVVSLFGEKEIWDLDQGSGILTRLQKERGRLLRSIKDLETEFEAGRLTQEEFSSLRREYKARAIAASRELERVRKVELRRLEKGGQALSAAERKSVEDLVAQKRA